MLSIQAIAADQAQVCPGAAAALAEGIHWDPVRQRLFWVDILHPWLYWFEPASRQAGRIALQEPGCWLVGSAGRLLLLGMCRSIGWLDPDTGLVTPFEIAQLNTEPAGNRLNDGGADRQGRLWFGTMDNAEQAPTGQLYRLDHRGLSCVDTGYVVSNGPVFSADGRYLFHASSASREIYRFDVSADGDLSDKQCFIRFTPAHGFPDGMALDAAGGLWVAQWQGGGLCRFDANGLLTNRVTLPVSNVTNLAFAGPDLRQLYITTARVGLTAVQLQQQPLAGRLFRFDVAIPGVAVPKVDLPY